VPHISFGIEAFEVYLRRGFSGGVGIVETQLQDRPSVVLGGAMSGMLKNPPPSDWNGSVSLRRRGVN